MPPYFMEHDGSLRQLFMDDTALTAEEKSTIAAWVDGGSPEGTKVALSTPGAAALDGRARGLDSDVLAGGAGRGSSPRTTSTAASSPINLKARRRSSRETR